ncbi:hypothetical protein CCP3SC1AL1_630007 [Gammaproteobacteria bacterium]
MKVTVTTPVVSTMTCIIKTNLNFDLDVIYKYTQITSSIKGIKYKNFKKGETNDKPSFGNQVTLILLLNGITMNVKVFNTKFQITGIKDPVHAYKACQYLTMLFKKIRTYKKINISYSEDGVSLEDNTNNIIRFSNIKDGRSIYKKIGIINSKHEYDVIPHLQETRHILNNDAIFPSLLRSLKQEVTEVTEVTERNKYKLYDVNFNCIGNVHYNFTRKKRVSINSVQCVATQDPLIFDLIDKYNTSKGTCIYTIPELLPPPIPLIASPESYIYDTAVTTKISTTRLELSISNCNASFSVIVDDDSTAFSFNMSHLYNLLIDKYTNVENINILFDPNRYSAIKVIFYKQHEDNTIKLSMCIFRSGKINVMGTRTKQHRVFLHKFAQKWFTLYNDYIILTSLGNSSSTEQEPTERQLTIHDLL